VRALGVRAIPLSYRVADKMRLSRDKTEIVVNPSLTLRGIPAEAFEYKLGNRSALEWVIDQYQVKGESDPNRADDEKYIVRLGVCRRTAGEGLRGKLWG
jgi:predicted helicase